MAKDTVKLFSTYLLDRALEKERKRREQRRQERLGTVFKALDELSYLISFKEAYVFGSLTKPYRFFEHSDVDVAFVGLRDKNFFQAIAFLSGVLDGEVDVLQLEEHPRAEEIIREGIQWKRKD